jgi:two-component system, NarL family, nitrate/nitrite response regulator NarL
MNTAAWRSALKETGEQRGVGPNGQTPVAQSHEELAPDGPRPAAKIRVFIAAENRLLRDALAKILAEQENMQVSGLASMVPFREEGLRELNADIFLFASRGNLTDDLAVIRVVRAAAPRTRILLMGMGADPGDFLQGVRAGISGYLLREASSQEVLRGIRAVHAGEAACPGALCNVLFRYVEREAALMPCGSARRRLGLTRREQQLIPLIAQGLTNKEIANHFSLSEQTVKNHLYRMKHKVGAEDRLDIVQLFRSQGFLT